MLTCHILPFVLLTGWPVTGEMLSWRETLNKEGGYRALFPGKTERGAGDSWVGERRCLVKDEFTIDAKGVGYLIAYFDYTADEREKAVPDNILKEKPDALFGKLFPKPVEVRDIKLGKYRGVAMSFRYTERGVSKECHTRIYLVRNRLFALGVLIVGDRRPTPYEIWRFFESFQIISAAAGKGQAKHWEKIGPPRRK
jgi:hypothetical protein